MKSAFNELKHTAHAVANTLAAVTAERDALQAFKDYVHQRLDEAGVPINPDGPHSGHGCRIGDRLDIVLSGNFVAKETRE